MRTLDKGWTADISLGINNDCPMEFRVLYDGTVQFLTAYDTQELTLSFESDTFSDFIELGASANTHAKARRKVAAPITTDDHDDHDDHDDPVVIVTRETDENE